MQNRKIIIINYGAGNIRSAEKALQLVAGESDQIKISHKAEDIADATHLVLPGVGAFGDAATNLEKDKEFVPEIKNQVQNHKKPFLGICVGMQLLATKGYENGVYDGLNLIEGEVHKIESKDGLRIPHMGWNNLNIKQKHPVLDGIEDQEHLYFVHSYQYLLKDQSNLVASVDYGDEISAIIAKDNIFATQFHPEKSGEVGLKILGNFLSWGDGLPKI